MRGGWRFDKTVSLGHILTAVTIVVPVFWWGSTVESRLSVLESIQETLASQQERNVRDLADRMDRDARHAESLWRDIKGTLERIESKVDRKVDRDMYPPPYAPQP